MPRLQTALALGVLGLLALACGGSTPSGPSAPAELFVYGQVQSEPAERPARFDAALPTTTAEFVQMDDQHPPMAWLSARACAGDQQVLDRLLAAHRQAEPGSQAAYGSALSWCQKPAYCEPVFERWGASTGPDRVLLAHFLTGCEGHDEVFEDPDLPDEVILHRYAGYHLDKLETYSPRLGQALRSLPPEGGFEARLAAMAHGEVVDERVAADLLVAYERVTDENTRGGILIGLRDQTTPQARALHAEWCASRPEDYACVPKVDYGELEDTGYDGPVQPAAARLVELGLAEPSLKKAGTWPLSQHGALAFDTETGMWPNMHDELLATLATLGPGLEDAVFLEDPPPDPDYSPEGYTLHAYAGGKHWWVSAEDLGDWYDVHAVLSLLNTMSRELGSPTRWVALQTGDQMSVVLAGDASALETARDEGLLDLASAGAGMDAGKAFEEEVLRQLQSGELVLE